MKKILVCIPASEKSYPIFIGVGLIASISKLFDFSSYSKIVVITDTNIEKLLLGEILPHLPSNTIVIKILHGEQAKSIECIEEIWRQMLVGQCDRKTLVINLGGGVIGDMGGFAASTFMRGVDFLQVPTTLLAQVDASTGGKTGINFGGVKNLIGAFKQPIGVLCDVSFLSTLPDREFIEGFGEIIKHGIIADKKYFNFVTSKRPKEFSLKELTEIVKISCEIKKEIIQSDVTEKDRRRLVNFGHTIGHAIESLSMTTHNHLLHGEAVSIGMVAEGKISVLQGMLQEEDLEAIIRALRNAGLPIRYQFDEKAVLEKIKSDKKSERGIVYFTLISAIGKPKAGQEISDEYVRKALQFVRS